MTYAGQFCYNLSMKCPKCGNENPDNSAYCGLCYEVLKKEEPKDAAPAPAQHKLSFMSLRLYVLSVLLAALAWVYVDDLLSRQWYTEQTTRKIAKILNDGDRLRFTPVKPDELADDEDAFPPDSVIFDSVYNVSGHTFEEICRNLQEERSKDRNLNERIGTPTFTNLRCDFDFESEPEVTDYGARWKAFKITPKNTLVYPIWNEAQAIRNIDENRWRIVMRILIKHEAGHARINAERAKLLEYELRMLTAPDLLTLNLMTIEKKRAFFDALRLSHDEYDAKLRPGHVFVKLHKKFK